MSTVIQQRETVYAQAMANAETWLKGTRHNMVAKAFGPHEGFLADVLTDDGNYTLKLRSNGEHSVLFMQAVSGLRVPPKKRDAANAFLARETEGMLEGRVYIDDCGSLVAHTTIDLDHFARQHRMISPLMGLMCRDGGRVDSETAQAVAELVGRYCAPDVEWYKELGGLLLHMVFEYEEALEKWEEEAQAEPLAPPAKVEKAKAGHRPANPDTDGAPGPGDDPLGLEGLDPESRIQRELFARFEELFGDSKKDEVPSPQELRSLLDGLSEEDRQIILRAGEAAKEAGAKAAAAREDELRSIQEELDARFEELFGHLDEEDAARLDQEFLQTILGEDGLRELDKFPNLGAFLESRSISELQKMLDRSVPFLAREDAPEAPAETPEEDEEDDDALLDAMIRKIDANHAAKKRQELGVDTGDVYTAPFTAPLPGAGEEDGEGDGEEDGLLPIPGILNIPDDEDGDE